LDFFAILSSRFFFDSVAFLAGLAGAVFFAEGFFVGVSFLVSCVSFSKSSSSTANRSSSKI